MASYDDLGKIFKSSYILEKGDYHFYIGTSVRDVIALDYVMTLNANLLVEQLSSKAAPASLKKRLLADGSYEELPQGTANDPNACVFRKNGTGHRGSSRSGNTRTRILSSAEFL
ncbi:beta-glucosidase A [human gut metagenome]|uniref:Beta-glucosidase A n=1 Tax=human gut metagenome TaxID=408170 RepID=K1SB36_9ZZZZ